MAITPTRPDNSFDLIALGLSNTCQSLANLMGYFEIITQSLVGNQSAEQQNALERAIVSAKRIEKSINNLTHFAEQQQHCAKLCIDKTTAAAIIEPIKQGLELEAKVQNKLLNLEIAPNLPEIAADKVSIAEIIVNLVDNALHYSTEGGLVKVTVKQKGDFVEFSVSDTGAGMSARTLGRLFREPIVNRTSHQLGVGLFLSKSVIDYHAGYINVESELGEGTTVCFGLPTYASVADVLKTNSSTDIAKQTYGWRKNRPATNGILAKPLQTVLFIEDDRFMGDLYVKTLEKNGFKVDWVTDDNQGLVQARDQAYDLIVFDLMLPERKGSEIIETLRADHDLVPNSRIIALTNFEQAAESKRLVELGVDAYITKSSITPERLIKIIGEITNHDKTTRF